MGFTSNSGLSKLPIPISAVGGGMFICGLAPPPLSPITVTSGLTAEVCRNIFLSKIDITIYRFELVDYK
jgi:hypothetical protein